MVEAGSGDGKQEKGGGGAQVGPSQGRWVLTVVKQLEEVSLRVTSSQPDDEGVFGAVHAADRAARHRIRGRDLRAGARRSVVGAIDPPFASSGLAGHLSSSPP